MCRDNSETTGINRDCNVVYFAIPVFPLLIDDAPFIQYLIHTILNDIIGVYFQVFPNSLYSSLSGMNFIYLLKKNLRFYPLLLFSLTFAGNPPERPPTTKPMKN